MKKEKKIVNQENLQESVPSHVVSVSSIRIVKERYQSLSSRGEVNSEDDMCEPNQAVDVKTLVLRALHGQPLGLSQGSLMFDDEDSSDDIGYRPMDKVEMAEERIRLEEKYRRSRSVKKPIPEPNPSEPPTPSQEPDSKPSPQPTPTPEPIPSPSE